MKAGFRLILANSLVLWASAQGDRVLRFEDFPAAGKFLGTYAQPVLTTAEELRYRTVIRNGINKGWGVQDGETGKALAVAGPNFAGHYVIVTWGCGSPCVMGAIVDLKNGRVFPPPFHNGPGHSYFQVPWAPAEGLALDFRLNSRLLIAHLCETSTTLRINGQIEYQSHKCGAHYFEMREAGLKLIWRDIEDE